MNAYSHNSAFEHHETFLLKTQHPSRSKLVSNRILTSCQPQDHLRTIKLHHKQTHEQTKNKNKQTKRPEQKKHYLQFKHSWLNIYSHDSHHAGSSHQFKLVIPTLPKTHVTWQFHKNQAISWCGRHISLPTDSSPEAYLPLWSAHNFYFLFDDDVGCLLQTSKGLPDLIHVHAVVFAATPAVFIVSVEKHELEGTGSCEES